MRSFTNFVRSLCPFFSTIYFLTRFIWESNCYCPEDTIIVFISLVAGAPTIFFQVLLQNRFLFSCCWSENSFVYPIKSILCTFTILKGINNIDLSKLMSPYCNLWCNLKTICCIYWNVLKVWNWKIEIVISFSLSYFVIVLSKSKFIIVFQ